MSCYINRWLGKRSQRSFQLLLTVDIFCNKNSNSAQILLHVLLQVITLQVLLQVFLHVFYILHLLHTYIYILKAIFLTTATQRLAKHKVKL